MPLRALRPGRSDKDLKRRSTLDPANLFRRGEQGPHAIRSAENLAPDRGIRSSDGLRPQIQSQPVWLVDSEPPPSPPIQEHNTMTRRFSKLRSRHASDPQLSAKAREQAAADAAADAPPVPTMPAAPAIIMTAPTVESPTQNPPTKKKNKFPTLTKRRLSFEPTAEESIPRKSTEKKHFGSNGRKTLFGGLEHLQDEPGRLSTSSARDLPTMTGSEANHALRPIGGRLSDGSSRSIESTGEHKKPALNTSHSTFFRLSRKNKEQNRKSLFPLPVKIPAPPEFPDTAPATPRASTSAVSVPSPHQSPDGTYSPPLTAIHRSNTDGSVHPDQSPTHSALASVVNVNGAPLIRNDSTTSAHSARSTPSLAPPVRLGRRGRSSTVGSVEGRMDDGPPPTPPLGYGRHSTSTTGRTSFSNLFGLGNRFRQNSEPQSPRHGSPGQGMTPGRGSQSTSMNISREALVVPSREEGEPPGKYLERLEEFMPRSTIAALVAKSGDEFSLAVLRSYMRRFMFFGDPIDMALRKLLMEVELPRETQQIDRVLQGFADRYHECNPGIFVSPEEAYFIAFSIVLLNSDFFNPNNKRKMQKHDYIKNCNGTSASEVNEDVLATIYENIVYTQFIHIDDEMDLRNIATRGKKKKIIKNAVQDPARRAQKEPIDPYTLIFENKLDALRPPIKEVMQFEDPYCYRGTAQSLDMRSLHDTFAKYGVIQIVSARSRPEAFMSPTTIENPNDAQAGVVEMPVTKVGILWRKDTKKKAARSPWQEWGVVLTRSSLYFFKSPTWARNLMHQHESHKGGGSSAPVIFKPAVEDFKSDHTVPMDLCVAAMDASYKKHKYAFVIFAKGGAEEVFLADNEPDMNDWLAKINYTAAFETAGIRPRGLTGGNYEGQRNRGIRRLESSQSSKSIQGPTGEVTIQSGKIDNHLAQQIASARRENIQRKVEEADERLGNAVKQLDGRLRDARHLQVMAPIQPRTREHVMHAAGRMAARLKWVRIDICRMKCHRDILIMDLDEEKKAAGESQARYKEIADSAAPASSPAPAAPPSRSSRLGSLVRLNSKASSATTRPQTSPNPPPPEIMPPREPEQEKDDDVFSTPPENSPQSSPGHSSPSDWVIPPMSFSPLSEPRHSLIMSKVENPDHRPSVSTTGEQEGSEHPSGSISDADHSHTRNQSTTSMNLDGRPSTPENGDQNPAGSPDSRAKMRRSMHRTLRDPHTSGGHRRSGKGKESSSTIMSEDAADKGPEVLPRAHGSFTVHGKKASVITFGSEWQDLSAEERLKLRKQALDDGKRLEIPTAHEDDQSVNGTEGAPSISTASESAHTVTNKPMVEKEGRVGLKPAPLDSRWNHLSAPGQQQSANAAPSISARPSVEDLSPTSKEFPKEAKDGDTKEVGDGQPGGPDPAIINTQPQAVGA